MNHCYSKGSDFLIYCLCLLLHLALLCETFGKETYQRCKSPIIRREWRTLSKKDRLSYISAVDCLLTKLPITPKVVASGVGSRYDDFIVTHSFQTLSIHYVGHFMAWHRYFTAAYEKTLRNERGYRIAQPYWDWTLDVPPYGNFTESPLFDSIFGFGSNGPFVEIPPGNPFDVPGRTGGGCVVDGPFKDMVVRIGPQDDITGDPRCLSRDFSPYFAGRYLGANVTKIALSQLDFGWFDRVSEGDPSFDASCVHGRGHYGVGGTLGEMGDLYNSPADPIFYTYHANLDRLWWSWQVKNLTSRLKDISGPINLLDYSNSLGGNVTLSFQLSIGYNGANTTIGDVMDIRDDMLCYEYDNLYDY